MNLENKLGLMYAKGSGVDRDEALAAEWVGKAARLGNPDAQFNLGVLYSRGRGVERDLLAAAKWHLRSARGAMATGDGGRLAASTPGLRPAIAATALVPALLIAWLLTARTGYRGRAGAIWKTLGLGAAVVLPVVIAALSIHGLVQGPGDWRSQGFRTAFLSAALPEEIGRFCILYFYCLRRAGFARPMDGLVFGVVAALGFSALENAIYGYVGGPGIAIFGSATATPVHLALGAVMGGLLALSGAAASGRAWFVGLALALPVLLHGLYDLAVLSATGDSASTRVALFVAPAIVLLAPMVVVYRRVRGLQPAQPDRD